MGGTDRSTSLRSDERSTSLKSVFHIPEIGVPLHRNTQTPPPPIPIDPDGGATRWAFAYVEAAMNDLINDPLGGSFGAVTIREYFYDLGLRLWGMIGLIMVVMQGLRMSAGARFDIWDVISPWK